jgi:acyl-CoA thioesterase-1
LATRDGQIDPPEDFDPVGGRLDGSREANDFDDWRGGWGRDEELLFFVLRLAQRTSSASGASVMIMAVSFFSMSGRSVPGFILAFALAACGSPGNHEQAQYRTPPPQPPANPHVPVQQPVSIEDTRPVIAAFGDSISAGFGVEAGKSFPDDLQRLIDAAGYEYRVENLGVSGDTTTDGVERLPAVLAVHPAIVILEFGGNDGLRGLPVESAKKNMSEMIEALQKSGIQILLAGMTLPRNYGPEYIRIFDQMYVDLSKRYTIHRIPFLLEGVGGHPDLVQPDGIHPTAEGAGIVAHNVMSYLQPLLSRRSGNK